MRKIFLSFIVVLSFFCFSFTADAFGTTVKGKTTINPGEEFVVTFGVTNGQNLMGIIANLNYDSSKLSVVKTEGRNSYNITLGTKIVADKANGQSGTFDFARITFKPTSSFAVGQSVTISLSNVTGSDGSDVSGTGSSLKVSMAAVKSSNNNLSTLTVNGSRVNGFTSSTTSYSMTVENNVSSINLGAVAADSKASVSGTGTKNLSVYRNSFSVVVTAENGSKKTYTLVVNRKDADGRITAPSTNNKLSDINIEEFDIDFKKDVFEYSITVDNTVDSLTILPKLEDSKASFKVEGPSSLIVGLNQITIKVTAENGSSVDYILKVNRESNSPLVSLKDLKATFASITADEIIVVVTDEDNIIDKELIDLISSSDKKIIITYYRNESILYSYEFKASLLSDFDEFSSLLSFSSPNKELIDELSNYADLLHLNFSQKGTFPNDTIVRVFVGNKFSDGTVLNLYYFTEDNIELISDDVKVESGFVSLSIPHSSEYFLTRSNILNEKTVDEKTAFGSFEHIIYSVIIVGLSGALFKMIYDKKKLA